MSRDVTKFYEYLSRNRHAANYIRIVDISSRIAEGDSSWWHHQVSSILQMLTPSLEKITLSSHGDVIEPIVQWSRFPETFRKAFIDCLWSPSIIEVSMGCIGGFPLSVFNPCSQLKRLSFFQVDCTPSTSAQFPPQIDSLVLSRSEDLATIVSWAKMGHHMCSLNFRLDQEVGFGLLIGLLDTYSDDLIELELDLSKFPFMREIYY